MCVPVLAHRYLAVHHSPAVLLCGRTRVWRDHGGACGPHLLRHSAEEKHFFKVTESVTERVTERITERVTERVT